VTRHATRVPFFWLVAVCGALCQNPPSTDLLQGLQFDGSHSPEMLRPEMGTWKSLPDAPSLNQPPAQAEGFHTFGNDSAGVLPRFCLNNCGYGYLTRRAPDFQTPLDKERLSETERLSVTPGSRHAPSASGGAIGRTFASASSILGVPSGSGRGKANTPDFLGVLTSVATNAAYRIGHDPLLRLSRKMVRPLPMQGPKSSLRFGLALGKK
jgi:hypothetical protein